MRKGINPADKIFQLTLGIFVLAVLILVAIQVSAPLRGKHGCTTAASVLSDLASGVNIC